MGRARYCPCEAACNRAKLDSAVSIHAVERFLGDLALRERWSFPAPRAATQKRVLVIGGGPSGLSAAYHLALAGHEVTLREAAPSLGGMMRYGIPRYRLSRDVLDAEIARIVDLGVRVETGTRVFDAAAAQLEGHFDACFAAIGAHLANRIEIPRQDARRILDALPVLREVEEWHERPKIGRRVAVYGGGSTALDAARSARRHGAEEALIVYRRTRAHMPAHELEMREAREEGIQVRWLRGVKRSEPGHIVVERMDIDEHGRAVPTGELESIEADALVLAIGQHVDLSVVERSAGVRIVDRVVQVDNQMMTGHPGLFAGGDMVAGERTIAVAVGHGERAARSIDAWLAASRFALPPEPPLAHFGSLTTWCCGEPERSIRPGWTRSAKPY
jgi:NADPH-dependent glutamate synthase beta subunit-like oxidoreductase